MWSLVTLCVFYVSLSAASDDYKVFRKCCPMKQSLIKLSGYGIVSTDSYKCMNSVYEISDNNVTNPNSHLIVDPGVLVEYGVPNDCDLQMVQLNEIIQLSTNRDVCYDRFVAEINNGTVEKVIPKTVALVCNGTEVSPETKLEIQNVRKCCPRGQVYDTEYHLCRGDSEFGNEEWIIKQLEIKHTDIVEFENGLHCKLEEYAVELKEGFFRLELNGDTLTVRKRSGDKEILVPKGNWCVDQEYTSHQLVARACTLDCSAFDAFCMRKCCPVGEHFQPFRCGRPASMCVPNTDDSILFNISSYMEPLKTEYGIGDIMGIRSEVQCKAGKIALNSSQAEDRHTLTKEGWLLSPLSLTNDYCLEAFDSRSCNDEVYVTAVLCFVKPPVVKDFRISFVLISISAACLALTLMVYCSIPELRNLHGLTLICHVSTMLLAYSCLARVQYNHVKNENLCVALGYGIYFGFVAAFAWLNVMCLDIWWTFGSVRTVQAHHKSSASRRRFFFYSLYAWGASVTLTLITYLLDRFPLTPVLDANMGHSMCWFGSTQNSATDWPHYIFFVIPMGLVSGVNFVLWALTARHCSRVKSEVHRLQAGSVGDRAKRRFRIDKANLTLTGKLWVVMGAGWISELISTLLMNPEKNVHWIMTIVDMVNELQGVLIFIILIFKPKLYYLIRKRLGCSRTSTVTRLEKPDARKNSASSSARTSSTFLSRTISTDERTNKRVSMPHDNSKVQ
ncbi:unnamed protein product [Diatraea saccharalis]|uniref:G-protein coupled receptors family 2 profile 2 domain-containing protein n=1 Tax=Diatraea saccharalis TaxID=40085 RepID=A0A9N9QW16_9NEOP|nr:unnamed protein product [Diatraea saccharalis]